MAATLARTQASVQTSYAETNREVRENKRVRDTGRTCSDRPEMPPTSNKRERWTVPGRRPAVGSTRHHAVWFRQTAGLAAGLVQSKWTCDCASKKRPPTIAELRRSKSPPT